MPGRKLDGGKRGPYKIPPALACPNQRSSLRPLLNGFAKRDKKAMLDVLLPDGGTTIIANGQVLQFNLRQLVVSDSKLNATESPKLFATKKKSR